MPHPDLKYCATPSPLKLAPIQALHNLSLLSSLDSLLSLVFAFIFGTAIGVEWQLRQRTAGLRTNALVAIAAAAVGAMCGADFIVQAGLVTAFVLAANTLRRYLVLYLNTRPTNTDDTESTYHLYMVCERTAQAQALDANDTEIEVLLMTTIARGEQLNAITTEMEQLTGVKGSFWHTSPLAG